MESDTKSRLVSRIPRKRVLALIAIAMVAVIPALVWFSSATKTYDYSLADAHGVERAVCYYLSDHGDLPDSIRDLVLAGYSHVEENGAWRVPRLNDKYPMDSSAKTVSVQHPEWFEIASNIHLSDVAEDGFIGSQNRYLIRPTPEAKYPGLEETCTRISTKIGRFVAARKARHSPASTSE